MKEGGGGLLLYLFETKSLCVVQASLKSRSHLLQPLAAKINQLPVGLLVYF